MRRVVIAAAAAALLGLAGCGGEAEPETPDAEQEVDQEQSAPDSAAEQWESSGELDNMPAEAAAALEPLVSAQTVADAFADAGLSDGEFTDIGAETEPCDLTDCSQALTIGEVTVMLYVSEEMAAAAADELGDAHAEGAVVLHYAPTETPEDVRVDYEAALSEALAE